MNILLLNAGSSSLKAALVASSDGTVVAHGLADWAGAAACYRYAGRDGGERAAGVPWRGHAQAVRRFVSDLSHTEPVVLPDRNSLAAVGHRIVHGGPFTS